MFSKLINIINSLSILDLIKRSFLALSLRILGVFGTYIFLFIINNYYGSEQLGIFSLAQATLFIVGIIATLGLDVLCVKIVPKYIKSSYKEFYHIYKKILFIVITFSICLAILLYFSSEFISIYFFNDNRIIYPLKCFSLCLVPFSLTIINSEINKGMKKIFQYSICNKNSFLLISSIFLLFFIFYYETFFPNQVYYSFCFSILVVAFFSTSKIFKSLYSNKFSISKKFSYKNLLSSSYSMMITNLSLTILQFSSIIFLGFYSSSKDVGVFTLIFKISTAVTIILNSVNAIAAPKISELFSFSNRKILNEMILSITKLTFYTSFPIILVILLFSNHILFFFNTNQKWIYALYILLFGQLINVASGSVGTILNMVGEHSILKNITLFSFTINIIINVSLIPFFGIYGAAVASSSSMIIWNILGIYYIYKKVGLKTYIRL